MLYTLTKDIRAVAKPEMIFGKIGDLVTLISCDNENIAIVESENGDRYCCKMDCLTIEEIKKPNIEAITPKPAIKQVLKRKVIVKTSSQTKLF